MKTSRLPRLKAWQAVKPMLSASILVALTICLMPARASADVSVSAPANGATVNSPFNIVAQAASCQNQTTASMAYSFDDQPDTIFQGANSINTSATANVGSHVLRVKAWGNGGALCQTNLQITVTAGAVAVIAPADTAGVSTTFLVRAQADTCSGQTTASMAYAFDENQDTFFNGASSIDTMVNTTSGGHLLRVKAWGNGGALCETDVNITAGTSSVALAAPQEGAGVGNPFSLQAQAPTCQGQTTTGMGYSFDYTSDTLLNGASSINTRVSETGGQHLLRVKAWGSSGAFCETDADVTITDQAVVVDAPANTAGTNSPFLLQAEAASCQGQPTSSMAYSFDYNSDTFFNGATSIDTPVSGNVGSHTLRVKAWGNGGALCETDLQIVVTGSSVSVGSPTNGASVGSPFSLQAQALSCQGQSTASMAYSFDYQTDTILEGATSINVNPTTTLGSHLLRVKAWGSSGAFCETDLDITVTNDGVAVTSPTDGATVDSPFGLHAKAPSCQGQATASMAYSFDESTDTILNGATSIDTSVNAPGAGAHLLRVKAWGSSGSFCETDVHITVNQVNNNPPPGLIPTPPGNAIHVANIDDQGGWGTCDVGTGTYENPDCGDPPGHFSFGPTSSPSYDGNGLAVSICCQALWPDGTYRGWFGELFYNNVVASLGGQFGSNYIVQWRFMVDQLPPTVWTVEFDFPLALKVGTQEMRYYFGTQCENGNDGSGTWDIWNPNLQGGSRWVHTSVACGTIQPNQWHEVRWYGTRTNTAYHYYVLEVDGQQYPIDVWIDAAPTGWSDAFIVQFQTDGDANADGYDMYVDDVQAWVW